mmetsp:Transcript_57604/g.122499  ORF Transcript_57604/g.122499 Transcript_57604/m.122499 type:complete len:304 (+) Transcript_57604:495-1406(+)
MGDLVLGAQSQSLVELAAILKFDLMSWCLNGALHVRLAADANSHCVASLRPSCSELADHDDVADHHASEVATELEGGQDALSEGASGKEGSLPSSFHTKGPVLSGVVEGNIVHVALSFREMGLGGGLELEAGADLLDPAACDATVQARSSNQDCAATLGLEGRPELVDVALLTHLGAQEEGMSRLQMLRDDGGSLDTEAVPIVLLGSLSPLPREVLERERRLVFGASGHGGLWLAIRGHGLRCGLAAHDGGPERSGSSDAAQGSCPAGAATLRFASEERHGAMLPVGSKRQGGAWGCGETPRA